MPINGGFSNCRLSAICGCLGLGHTSDLGHLAFRSIDPYLCFIRSDTTTVEGWGATNVWELSA
jgi:hypothetical protein